MSQVLRCALYPRVSTEEQFLHGLSLEAQRADLTDYAERMGYQIVGIYADEGISARKPVSRRPALLRLLEDVKQNKIDIILVTKLDRWFRNIKEYQITEEILRKHNCHWKTIHENYDTSTANGQMVVNIMLSVAQNECDRTGERIKAVFRHKILNKEHVTGAAPYGYVLSGKKLEKDPETEEIVRDIFALYFSTFSKRRTVYEIQEKYRGHPKSPTQYQLVRVLRCEVYAGIYQGRENYFPAYITPEQFRMLRSHTDSKIYPHTCEPYIFSGLLRCPVCQAAMSGAVKKQTLRDGSVRRYKRYRCSRKYGGHPNGACISETVVEAYMLDRLCAELGGLIFELRQSTVRQGGLHRPDAAAKLCAEMDRLNLLFQKGRITEQYYDRQYECLEQSLRRLPEECEAGMPLRRYEALQSEFRRNWRELYGALDASHKNAFWKRILKEIFIDEHTHRLCGCSFLL